MKYVFVHFTEGFEDTPKEERGHNFTLLDGDQAEVFLNTPDAWLKDYNNAELIDSWVVPDNLENLSGSVPEVLEALVALDRLGDTPVVSDLLATIFEAGYELAANKYQK